MYFACLGLWPILWLVSITILPWYVPPGFLVEALESSETPWNFLKLRNLLCFFFFINIVILLHTSFRQLWFAAALFMPLKSTKPKSGLICDKSWRTWYLFWFVYLVLLKSSFKVWPWVRLSGSVTPDQISIFLEGPILSVTQYHQELTVTALY